MYNKYYQRFLSIDERFWQKVKVGSPESCWLWQANKSRGGYGKFFLAGRGNIYAHRFAYELAVGPIPKGMQIDHLCRNRACVNPDHMESVSSKTNTLRGTNSAAGNARKTHCLRGHAFTEANTYLHAGSRLCRQCRWDQSERRKQHRGDADHREVVA